MKRRSWMMALLLAAVMVIAVIPAAAADYSGMTAEELRASMQNANELADPTDRAERAARGVYLPYTGYFEETLSAEGVAGRKVKLYIPEGASVRDYVQVLALPNGADAEAFLLESGWIDVADEERVILMVLLPADGKNWGTYEEEFDYINYMINTAGSGRRWYSVYSTYYVAGYGEGGDVLQQYCAREPLFIISQAYFDSAVTGAELEAEGNLWYGVPGVGNANQNSKTLNAPETDKTFRSVQKKEVPVPTYFFGGNEEAAAYWMAANEVGDRAEAAAGPLGSDLYKQVKDDAIATGFSSVVSEVAVLAEDIDYLDPAVTRAVYAALSQYTRYTNTSALSNALGWRVSEKEGVKTVDIYTTETDNGAGEPLQYKRTYIVYVPESVKEAYAQDGTTAPVVFALGGNGNNAYQYFESSQYVEIADKYGFSLVFPSEHTADNGVTTTWRIGEDEYNFIRAVIKDLDENQDLLKYFDEDRYFVMGHSQGAMFTNSLSVEMADTFTAFATMGMGASAFAEDAPAVPMYSIIGEYDLNDTWADLNVESWTNRLGFNVEDGVVTDPFDLPAETNNPIEYLIYPDSTEYPGDKFVTTSWYDENGVPVFNNTIAYGREHNNTVPDAWRIWEDWFSKWDRDEDGNRVYLGEKQSSGLPFSDVAETAWYRDAVAYAYDSGLMSGTSATQFSPNATTTRAMIVTMLYRLEGEPAVSAASAFTDVAGTAYYADAVAWANANGIVTGTSDTAFSPSDPITRQQMATILYRYAQYKSYDTTAGGMAIREYADYEEISAYAQTAMDWAVASGLITGTTDTTLTPDGSATRAQVATIFQRFQEDVAK